MCKPHIWSVLCLLLYEKEGSLNLLKLDILLLITGYRRPPGQRPPSTDIQRRPVQRPVRILLEYILVSIINSASFMSLKFVLFCLFLDILGISTYENTMSKTQCPVNVFLFDIPVKFIVHVEGLKMPVLHK